MDHLNSPIISNLEAKINRETKMGLQIWGILFKQSKIGPEELEKMRHVRHIIYTQFRDVGI